VAGPANGVLATASAPIQPPPSSTVLCLSIGQSGLRRLVELAELEGIDASTLATNLLLFELGKQMLYARARLAQQQAQDTSVAAVCLACGRERTDPRQGRCQVCGGSWTTAIR
jgi:hypothetical protein